MDLQLVSLTVPPSDVVVASCAYRLAVSSGIRETVPKSFFMGEPPLSGRSDGNRIQQKDRRFEKKSSPRGMRAGGVVFPQPPSPNSFFFLPPSESGVPLLPAPDTLPRFTVTLLSADA